MESIENKIIALLMKLNYKKRKINDYEIYESEGKYLKLTFLNLLDSYVIEYADSYDEAKKNLFEDGDLYPVSMDDDVLICKMRDEIINS